MYTWAAHLVPAVFEHVCSGIVVVTRPDTGILTIYGRSSTWNMHGIVTSRTSLSMTGQRVLRTTQNMLPSGGSVAATADVMRTCFIPSGHLILNLLNPGPVAQYIYGNLDIIASNNDWALIINGVLPYVPGFSRGFCSLFSGGSVTSILTNLITVWILFPSSDTYAGKSIQKAAWPSEIQWTRGVGNPVFRCA